jgi:hypothetical protein
MAETEDDAVYISCCSCGNYGDCLGMAAGVDIMQEERLLN